MMRKLFKCNVNMFSVIVIFSSAMVKWKVLLQLMGLMSRSLILVLLKSPDAPDLHSKHWIACCQAGIAATNPCFTRFHFLLNGKSSQLNQWSAPVNNCLSLFFRNPIKRKLYCVSISVKHLCANSRLAQMLDLCITCPSNWWDGESCSKAAVLEWQRSEYKYWGPVASGPPQPLFPITSQRGGKVQRIHSPVAQWAEVTFLNPRQYNCIVANSVRTLS